MIRKANAGDLPAIIQLYASARRFMAETGNPTQWGQHFPPTDLLVRDIEKGQLFVEEADGVIHGVFAFILGEDPTYREIASGAWLSDAEYGTIHRAASDRTKKGFLTRVVSYCRAIIPHLRIDTHADNKIMQHQIEKNGFTRCGTIFTDDHSPRIAYESVCP